MNQRGTSESSQWAVLLPTLLALVLGLVQVGVWLHGRSVAAQAAALAADVRATGVLRAAEADRLALQVATRGGLSEVTVSTTSSPASVVVTVTGRVPVFFDVGQSLVVERAVLPLETVRAP